MRWHSVAVATSSSVLSSSAGSRLLTGTSTFSPFVANIGIMSSCGDAGRPGLTAATASAPAYPRYGGVGFSDSAVRFPDRTADFSGSFGALSGSIGDSVIGLSSCISGCGNATSGGFAGRSSDGCGGGRSMQGLEERDDICDRVGDILLSTLCVAGAANLS